MGNTENERRRRPSWWGTWKIPSSRVDLGRKFWRETEVLLQRSKKSENVKCHVGQELKVFFKVGRRSSHK